MHKYTSMISICFFSVALSTFTTTTHAAESDVQMLRWNVFLSDWHLLGPFPNDDKSAQEGLGIPFVQNEAKLKAGQVAFYNDKLYTWKPYEVGPINFRAGLKAKGPGGQNVVAYAWTQFISPIAQKAVLGVGYDDAVVVWVNGQEVCRGNDNWAASLDQASTEVDLQKGVNTLLLKVAQGIRGWEAAARFRPAGLDEPILTFRCRPTGGDVTRMPVVKVTLLDAQQNVIAEHKSSGLRNTARGTTGGGGYYALYAPMPKTLPAAVRFTIDEPEFKKVDTTFAWKQVQRRAIPLQLAAAQPLQLVVVDKMTRRPIQGAEVWTNAGVQETVSDERGRIVLPEFSPMANQCWVAAKGFAAQRTNLKWPRGELQGVELIPGGRTLAGTVVSSSGEPLAGATVVPGLYGGYSPTTTTDENGRFEIYSIPDDRDSLYPVISCQGYITKDGFALPLKDATTDVKWELAPGATISGRVTHQDTGEPIAGVTITTGQDRFGSNNKNPTAKTDADGRYRLLGIDIGGNLVHAISDSHAPAMQSVSASIGKSVEANFQLSDGKPVTGQITNQDGMPLAGVRLITDTWSGARMFRREARSDRDGRFTLAHMPESVAEVDILKQGYISTRNYQMRGGDVVELTMLPEITHSISIRDGQGKRIPGLQISKGYLWNGNSQYSWSSSEWETTRYYNKLTGDMKIVIDEPTNAEIAYRFRATGFREALVKLPRDATGGEDFDVTLEPATVFKGRVVDASSGRPLPNIAVALVNVEDRLRSDQYVEFHTPWDYIKSRNFSGQQTVTGADGAFRLSVPSLATKAGIVLLSEEGGFHYVRDLDKVLQAKDLVEKRLVLPFPKSGTIEGHVTIAGKPLANSRVYLQWMLAGNENNSWDRPFGAGGQLVTDADGKFNFPRLGPGRYRISRVFNVDLGGGRSTSQYLGGDDLVLLPGQSLVHNIERPAGLTISGKTLDDNGNPLAGCIVSATVSGDNSRRIEATKSDDNGRFALTHLAPGSYDLTAEHYPTETRYYGHDFRGTLAVDAAKSVDGVEIHTVAVNRNVPQVMPQLTGTLAPDFTVTPQGADVPFKLSESHGKVVAISFWHPWFNDISAVNDAFKEFRDNPDVEFITVFLQEDESLREYLKKAKVEFPVVATEADQQNPLSATFGVQGQPGCIVVGRDGRFASERIMGNQLAAAIKRALPQQVDATVAGAEPARLSVILSADGGDRGVPAAELELKAFDASGKTIHEDKYALPGLVRQVSWRYPGLRGKGRVVVTLRGLGIDEKEQTIAAPSEFETLQFNINSPQKITGRILNSSDDQPIAGMEIKLQSTAAGVVSTRSDARGHFSLPCFPGTYYARAISNDDYAMVSASGRTVTVQAGGSPKPLELKATPAVTIRGRVLDESGEPVAGATVTTGQETKTTTDSDGNFTLAGVPAAGQTQLWAVEGEIYGRIRLADPNAQARHTITLGQGLNDDEAEAVELEIGSPAPPLSVATLAGEPVTWQSTAPTDRLLVFCPLWHPTARSFLQKAVQWATENKAAIELISLDWNLEQARREAGQVDFPGLTFFAGPGTLRLDNGWKLHATMSAIRISADGTVLGPLKL